GPTGGLSDATVRSYRSDLASLSAYAADHGIHTTEQLDLETLRSWQWDAANRDSAPASLARRSSTARGFTRWLARHSHTATDIGARLRAPTVRGTRPRVLTRSQIDHILDNLAARAATDDPVAIRDHALIEILYATALRV